VWWGMSIHDVCTLHAVGNMRSIAPKSPSYPLIGTWYPSWGTRPPLDQAGPSIAPENWDVDGTLAGLQQQRGSIRDGHVGGVRADSHSARARRFSPLRWLLVNRRVVNTE